MLSREQVLHVARPARLELTDEEIERMAAELSKVLDHMETIGELDLADVEPTSHVVAIENALRADGPRPCLPQEVALASAPPAAPPSLARVFRRTLRWRARPTPRPAAFAYRVRGRRRREHADRHPRSDR